MFSLSKLLCLSLLFTLAAFVNGLPAADNIANDLARRAPSATAGAPLSSPTSVTTTKTVQTSNGPMTETCVLTFTPEGSQVQEVQNCTYSSASTNSTSTTTVGNGTGNAGAAPSASTTVTPNAVVAAKFTVPGRQLLVLPVGLGVFGGISAIVLIAVIIVTFERVQYRRAFRQRKMAEVSPMGYNGYGGTFKA